MPKLPRTRPRRSQSPRRRRVGRGGEPPPLSSPFETAPRPAALKRVLERLCAAEPGTRLFKLTAGELRDIVIQGVNDGIAADRVLETNWPPGLFIPAGADPRQHWASDTPPAANRYALSWTNGIGFATASVADGSLHAVAMSPTVQGAIDGKAEAGVGVIYQPNHTLVRLRIDPDLRFTGLYQFDVDARNPVVLIRTYVLGSVLVGAYQSNPATGGWEHVLNYTWRRHVLFEDAHQVSGSEQLVSVPFKLSGAAAGHTLNAEAGRSYLLSVVAQVALRIETLDARGRRVNVTSGKFDTFGSVTGVVRQIWVDQQVLVN